MNEAGTAAGDVLIDALAEGAGLALYCEAGPAALAELGDRTGVVLSAEALLATYDERRGAALVELDGTGVGVG